MCLVPQVRFNSRQKLLSPEGLHDIVIAPILEGLYDVSVVILGRQDYDRNVRRRLHGPDPSAHLESQDVR